MFRQGKSTHDPAVPVYHILWNTGSLVIQALDGRARAINVRVSADQNHRGGQDGKSNLMTNNPLQSNW